MLYLCCVKKKFNKRKQDFIPQKQEKPDDQEQHNEQAITPTWPMRLNRYLAQSGVCSRRNARTHIEAGEVKVNDEVVLEMGHRVYQSDKVSFQEKEISPRKKTYILLNKPKNTITTTSDPQGRRTVMDVLGKSGEFLYPVGRLDRQTTGLLLLTNDGDLAQKLAHPSYEISKLYAVETDKPVSQKDIVQLSRGVKLEEGIAIADEADYVKDKSKHHVGVKIHFGWNRVVRRMFEALGYKVIKLDRVIYAGLTKLNLPRGKFRHLKDSEIRQLKHFTPKKKKQ